MKASSILSHDVNSSRRSQSNSTVRAKLSSPSKAELGGSGRVRGGYIPNRSAETVGH